MIILAMMGIGVSVAVAVLSAIVFLVLLREWNRVRQVRKYLWALRIRPTEAAVRKFLMMGVMK